jgi:hypothetical protein
MKYYKQGNSIVELPDHMAPPMKANQVAFDTLEEMKAAYPEEIPPDSPPVKEKAAPDMKK